MTEHLHAKNIFERTCANLGIGKNDTKDIWSYLVDAYTEDYRVYHNLDHIEEMVTYLDIYYPYDETKDLILFAAFFHDFHNTKDPLAEELSAQWATTYFLGSAYYNTIHTTEEQENDLMREAVFIHGAIMATKTHETNVAEWQWLVDADLQRFMATDNRYADQIREEYSEHSDEKFNAGRPVVLKRFLNREPFFYHGSEAENQAAKENIQRQLDELV